MHIGKLPGAVAERYHEWLTEQGFITIAISTDYALRVDSLSGPDRDPFDRM
jgi:PIN domain nuclease of toxin-antitoxin system